MTSFYKSAWKLGQLPAFLVCLFLFSAQQSWGQMPYELANGPYTEGFEKIASWGANFTSATPGTGVERFSVATPDPVFPNSNTVFSTGSGGGVQKGAEAIVLLATGATDGDKASAFDLNLDFTNTAAGTISLDWTQVSNSTGNRQATFKLQTNTGEQGAFIDLPGSTVVITNNVASNGSLTSVPLPADFAGNATAKIRFFIITTSGGTTGSRPKISIDNVRVATTNTPAPATSITTTASAFNNPYCITATAGSAPFDVAFTANGTFTGAFKVQLSNVSGVFPGNATENIIGSGATSPISAVIPAGTASGTEYRVRVVNDAPVTSGTNNGTDLTISLTAAENAVSVAPATAQSVTTTGTGATLTATAATGSTFTWLYGTSAAGPYSSPIGGATAASYTVRGANFPGIGTYYVVAQAALTTTCGTSTGLSSPVAVTVTAAPTTPALTVSAAELPAFGNLTVGAGAAQKTFTVSGSNLTGNVIITPPAGFEIRTGNKPFACCSIELQPASGTVLSTTIDVRFAPTAAQAYQTAIPVTATGLPEQQVKVSGVGVAAIYPATLGTAAISALTPTSASTGGAIATDGGSPITARGIVWAKTVNPTLSVPTKTVDGAGTGEFVSAIAELLPGTTYYVRAYATNGAGTAYGEERTFTTVTVPLAAEPTTPATLMASDVTGSSLQLNLAGGDGKKRLVLARIGSAVDAAPVDATTYTADAAFGKGTRLGTNSYVVYNGTGNSVTLTELRPNTEYHFAVFAFNDNDTPYAENYLITAPGVATATTLAAPAALLLEENFAYEPGLLTANNWLEHSGGTTNAIPVVEGGLSYNSYGSGNIGNSASLVGTGQDVNRQFAAPVFAGTPAYVSFLVKVTSAGKADYFMNLGQTVLGNNFKGRVFTRQGSSADKVEFGISGNGTNITYASAEYNVNETYLLVVKYTFDEAGSTSELFINPAVSAEPATAAAAVTETNGSPANIGTIALRQGGSTTNSKLLIDGIRVGTTYRVVRTGLICLEPVPAFTASAACVGAPVTFTDKSTVVEPNATYAWDVNSDGKVDYTTKGAISHSYAAVGTYTATLTITQGACSAVSTQTITVNALPEPKIVATPANNVYTGGVVTNLYLGYGPQSLTLTASGGATYSWSGPAGLSNTDSAMPVFTATTPGTFTYVVTVTNAAGCQATQQVTITVLDVRCSNNDNTAKILVCKDGIVMCVSENAVATQLADKRSRTVLGSCSPTAANNVASAKGATNGQEVAGSLFEAYPNPFTERAALRFRLVKTSKTQLQVFNSVGQLVATLYNGVAEQDRNYEFSLEGSPLPEGMYTCRLTTEGKVVTKRLVLVK